jgi:N-acetylglucosaminyl-diphospho-decaprenol L-rhamnosyltransferase
LPVLESARRLANVDVSLVIVTFNNAPVIERCLRSVRASVPTSLAELLIVDNASSDNTVELLHRLAPEAELVLLERNVGFASANNVALKKIAGRYAVLINSDAFPDEGAVERLIERANGNAKIGLVGGRLRYESGEQQPSAGTFPSLLNNLAVALLLHRVPVVSRLPLSVLANQIHYREARRVDWVSAAFCLVRPAIGAIPAGGFMYGEDVEWSLQARSAGYETWLEPAATAVHLGAGGSRSVAAARIRQRRRLEFELRWFGARGRAVCAAARAIMVLHAGVRIVLYVGLVPVRPRLASDRIAEFWTLLTAALRPSTIAN